MVRTTVYVAIAAVVIVAGCKDRQQPKSATVSNDFRNGEYYDYYQQQDSAFYYYNRVVQNSTDSVEKATAYFKMGLWQLRAGDYYSAQESFLLSIKPLDKEATAHHGNISASYNSLANATLNLKDYEGAIRNYHLAFEFTPNGDPRLYVLNNIGVAYQKQGNYQKAVGVFDSALSLPTSDTSLKAKLISNLARTRWLADSSFYPVPEFMTALALRKSIKDSLGMNASYAHLSDYYTRSRPDSALYYGRLRFEVAQALYDPADRLEALAQLVKVSPPDQTKRYVRQYLALDDSLTDVHNRDRNQFVLIKFDAEKSKADNLMLEKHLGQQRLLTVIVVLVAVGLVVGLWVWSRNRRRKIKTDAEKAIQQSRLQTSQKVHDVVANGLYRVMNELEHRETIEKDVLLDKIELLYEKSRNISYEDPDTNDRGYRKRIHQLITSFHNQHTAVTITDGQELFWERLTTLQQRELELVLEELLVNMQKHSQATEVKVCMQQDGGKGYIEYRDNGVGFRPGQRIGNGLRSTVNRIHSINGDISFGKSGKERGTCIFISFPLASVSL